MPRSSKKNLIPKGKASVEKLFGVHRKPEGGSEDTAIRPTSLSRAQLSSANDDREVRKQDAEGELLERLFRDKTLGPSFE